MSSSSQRRRRALSRRSDDRAGWSFRALEVRAKTIDEEGRSVEATVSTEQPIPMWDWERGEPVPEVLLSTGAEWPKSRQVPLLDSHSRYSTTAQLGSVRELRVEEAGVVGRLVISAAHEAEWIKVREGHLTDVSVGYHVLKREYVPEGKTKTIRGRQFVGPVNVAVRWRLHEVSLTPIGADDQAKLRGAERNAKDRRMTPELRALLIARGMPAELDDDAAAKWMFERAVALVAPPAPPPANPAPPAGERKAGTDGATTSGAPLTAEAIRSLVTESLAEALKKAGDERAAQEAAFRTEVDQLCALANLPDLAAECRGLGSIDAVRKRLIDEKAARAANVPVAPVAAYVTADHRDKHRAALATALAERVLSVAAVDPNVRSRLPEHTSRGAMRARYAVEQRAAGWQDFRYAGLFDLARQCCLIDGLDERSLIGLSREQIAWAAFGLYDQAGVRSGIPALHVSASFPYLVQDAMNLSLQIGYTEAPSTWEGPMRRGDSVENFKDVHRMRLGAVPNLPIWADNTTPNRVSMKDAEEKYAVECRSATLDFSYKLVVNDSLDALSRALPQLGNAARRTVNSYAWSLVTSNPAMGDGVALFSDVSGARKRKNLTTGAGAPSVTTVGTLTALMRLMRGENTPEGAESDDVLNLMPRYIVVPAALETTAKQLVLSIADPASSNPSVHNPASTLIPVVEGLLDANSATAWYLFASPQQIDTAEISFLRGQEQPVLTSWIDPETKAIRYNALQSFGGKFLNHRGVQKHAGA